MVHIYVLADKKHLAMSAFKRIYTSAPRPDYPLGIPWRFVPNMCDPDLPVAPKMRNTALSLRFKQQAFNTNTMVREYSHIRGLHKALPTNPMMILLKILMSWHSLKFPKRLLFVAAEQAYDFAPVTLSYSQDMDPEIDAIVPVLPIILEGQFGIKARDWFTELAWASISDFIYDHDTHKVVMQCTDYMSELHDNWQENNDDCRLR